MKKRANWEGWLGKSYILTQTWRKSILSQERDIQSKIAEKLKEEKQKEIGQNRIRETH